MSRPILMSLVAAASLQVGCGSKDKPAATPAPTGATAPAAPAVDGEPPVGATDEAPVAPDIAPEVLKAIESGQLGCIGFTPDGDKALVVMEHDTKNGGFERNAGWHAVKHGDVMPTVYAGACGDEGLPDCEGGGSVSSDSEKAALKAAAKGQGLVPCAPTAASTVGCNIQHPSARGGVVPCIPGAFSSSLDVWPLGKKVSIVMTAEELQFEVEGGAKGVITRFDASNEDLEKRELHAFASAKTAHVIVTLVARTKEGLLRNSTFQIRGSELGIEPCVAVEGTAPVAAELGPVPEKAIDVGCFAMAANGKSAMMAVASADTMVGVDETGTVQLVWAGEDLGGTLDCFADSTTCAGEDTPARKAFIEAHGLTACPKPTTELRVGASTFPIVAEGDRLWWTHPTLGSRWLKTFEVEANDGGRHESFFAAWQHPKGGSLFVMYSNEDTGLSEKLAVAIPESAFGVCPAK